jgi:hypothetical protein
MENKSRSSRVWIARVLIAAVTIMNVQSAFQFMLHPQDYAWGFELTGVPGEAMVRGMGVLFLMWNVPYIFAAVHSVKHFISLIEAVIMQFIGVIGESVILLGLPGDHPFITSSVTRFIIFDGAGLVVLVIALLLILSLRKKRT